MKFCTKINAQKKASTHLKEQFLSAFGTVTEVNRADVTAPPTRGTAAAQQIGGVQQYRVQRVDPYAASHKQQIHGGVSGRRVEEEVPPDTHGHPGADSALRERENNRNHTELFSHLRVYTFLLLCGF